MVIMPTRVRPLAATKQAAGFQYNRQRQREYAHLLSTRTSWKKRGK